MVCRYFDPETVGLDFDGMAEDLKAAPEGSIIVLHGVLHAYAQASWFAALVCCADRNVCMLQTLPAGHVCRALFARFPSSQ